MKKISSSTPAVPLSSIQPVTIHVSGLRKYFHPRDYFLGEFKEHYAVTSSFLSNVLNRAESANFMPAINLSKFPIKIPKENTTKKTYSDSDFLSELPIAQRNFPIPTETCQTIADLTQKQLYGQKGDLNVQGDKNIIDYTMRDDGTLVSNVISYDRHSKLWWLKCYQLTNWSKVDVFLKHFNTDLHFIKFIKPYISN